MKIQILILLMLFSTAYAQNTKKQIDVNNISVTGLDKNVANVFDQTRQLIQQARDEKDSKTELAASKQWCLLLHNFEFLLQAQECYYIIGLDDKNNAKWPYLYAKASAELGDFEQATIGFTETIRRDVNYLPAYYYLIQQSLNDNNLLTSFELLGQVPANLRLKAVMLNLTGDLYFAVENHHVAIGFYKQALQLAPDAKSMNYKIARVYQAMDLIEQAESFMKISDATKIKVIDPYYQEVKSTTIGEIPYLIKAKTALVNGDIKSAIVSYKKALEYNPQSESAMVNIAVAYFQDKQINLAKQYFGKVLMNNPEQLIALYNLAIIAKFHNDINRALEFFERFNAIKSDDVSVNYSLVQIYYQQGKYEKVFKIALLASMKTHLDTQYLKAKSFIQLQQYTKAIHWLTEINTNVPDEYKVLLALAKILSQVPDLTLRDAKLSLEYAKEAINIDTNAQSYWQLIMALDENKQCNKLKSKMQELSQLLKADEAMGYERLKQQRGNELKCPL